MHTSWAGGWGFSLWVSSNCGGTPVQTIVNGIKPSVFSFGIKENYTYLARQRDADLPIRIDGAFEGPKTRLQELAKFPEPLPGRPAR